MELPPEKIAAIASEKNVSEDVVEEAHRQFEEVSFNLSFFFAEGIWHDS